MAHTCPTCQETCYCMGDHSEVLSGTPSFCIHCAEYLGVTVNNEPDYNYNWDGTRITEFDEDQLT